MIGWCMGMAIDDCSDFIKYYFSPPSSQMENPPINQADAESSYFNNPLMGERLCEYQEVPYSHRQR